MRSTRHYGRKRKQVFENLRITTGLIVIVLAIITFFLYQKSRIFFALCFFAAGAMNFFEGCAKLTPGDQHKRETVAAVFWYLCAVVFVVLGVLALIIRL